MKGHTQARERHYSNEKNNCLQVITCGNETSRERNVRRKISFYEKIFKKLPKGTFVIDFNQCPSKDLRHRLLNKGRKTLTRSFC